MTVPYRIIVNRPVLKTIRVIPRSILHGIRDKIASLATDPFPYGVESVKGRKNCYRIRFGSYRIVYEVAATIRIITVIRIGHRKDVYKNL